MVIVKFYEKDRFKIALQQESRDLFRVLVLDDNASQIISGREMDYDTANEIYDFIIDSKTSLMLENIKVEVKDENTIIDNISNRVNKLFDRKHGKR